MLWRGSASFRGLLPHRADYAGVRQSWRADVIAGLTVGVVALPLALAFGITTGLGAAAGLTTAIVAGLVAAVFGGSNVQVSGPTGAMTVVLVPLVARYGADAVVGVGVLAGVFVVVAGLCRLGRLVALHAVAGRRGLHDRDRRHHLPAAGARRLGVAKPRGREHCGGRRSGRSGPPFDAGSVAGARVWSASSPLVMIARAACAPRAAGVAARGGGRDDRHAGDGMARHHDRCVAVGTCRRPRSPASPR